MSDNEFFFDDDKKDEPAPKAKSNSGGAVKKKPVPKSSPRPEPAVVRGAAVAPQQSVTVTIAVLIGVVGLLVGMIVGIFVGRAMVPETVSAPNTTTSTPMGTGGMGSTGAVAPPLTDEQIQAGMPEGHGENGPAPVDGTTPATPAP